MGPGLPEALEPEVHAAVERAAALGPATAAAFDADGTLWAGDVGEDLLQTLQSAGRLARDAGRDPFAEYLELLGRDPARAFAHCLQVMRGLRAREVEQIARELARKRFRGALFPAICAAFRRLRRAGVHLFVVSASTALSVRAALEELELGPAQVLAVDGPVDASGRLTGVVWPPVTCGPGKAQAVSAALAGRRLAIAFGNSLLDREMLQLAERAVLVAPLHADNQAISLAIERGWPIQRMGRAAP